MAVPNPLYADPLPATLPDRAELAGLALCGLLPGDILLERLLDRIEAARR